MHPYINTAITAARKAADIIMHGYERSDLVKVSKKRAKDFVTDIDRKSERAIIDILRTAYPNHGILAEESGHSEGDEYLWIIDPLDGTNNFVHGLPHFSISIALQYRNKIEHGLIYDPVRDDLFTASRGEGAQKNNRRIRVGQRNTFEDCFISTGTTIRDPQYIEPYFDALKEIAADCLSIRACGSSALDLAYVASGQIDGYFKLGLSPWDMAAGILLVKEAGGLMSDFQGGETYLKTGKIVTANPKIFKELIKIIKPKFKDIE